MQSLRESRVKGIAGIRGSKLLWLAVLIWLTLTIVTATRNGVKNPVVLNPAAPVNIPAEVIPFGPGWAADYRTDADSFCTPGGNCYFRTLTGQAVSSSH